jgi:hypothetical protein
VLESLSSCDALVRVHLEHLGHQINLHLVHASGVTLLQRLRVWDVRELETGVARVATEFILQELR